MSRLIFLIIMINVSLNLIAYDTIILKNGDEIQAQVVEVAEDKVAYKKTENLKGPLYSVAISKIFMIKYENGSKDVFQDNNVMTNNVGQQTESVSPQYSESIRAVDNELLIKRQNPKFTLPLGKNGRAKEGFPVMYMSSNSIVSTDDVNLQIKMYTPSSKYYTVVPRCYIDITNKTESIIYVDKGCSFKITEKGIESFFDNKIISTSTNSGSGIGIGLGAVAGALGVGGVVGQLASGMSVGTGSSSGVSTTYSDQRVIAIPPHGTIHLQQHAYEDDKWVKLSEAERFWVDAKKFKIPKNGYIEFEESNSPIKREYFIVYSKDSSFSKYSSLRACVYCKYIIAGKLKEPLLTSVPAYPYGFSSEKNIIESYKKYIPEIEDIWDQIIVGERF